MEILAFVLFFAVSVCSAASEDPLHSRDVTVAKCRAQCLDKFTWTGWTPSDLLCQKEADCFMCWESCDFLEQNFVVWGAMCGHPDICFPGCQQSCGYYLQGTPTEKPRASFTLKFSKPMNFEHQEASHSLKVTWVKPLGATAPPEDATDNIVYVILRRSRISGEKTKWQEVDQTSELTTTFDINLLPPSTIVDFKVLAVTGAGLAGQLVTSYYVSGSAIMIQDGKPTVLSPNVVTNEQVNSRWRLHLVTMSHNTKLGSVDAIVTWATPGLTGNFLVTWEVKEGTFAITGHLYTDSTTVSLTLWPDTVYSVQVELVSSALEQALRSEPLTVDTRAIDGHGHKGDNAEVIEAPKAECNTTLIIASLAVAASLLVILVGIALVIRRWRRKSTCGQPPNCESLQRVGAIRRKMSLPHLPLETAGGFPNPATPPKATPPSSILDDKLSAFRIFFENLDNKVTESLSPKQTSFAYSLPQTIPEIPVVHTRTCPIQRPRLQSEILFVAMEDGVLEDGCAFESVLPTEKLLGKTKAKRSQSTAI